MARFGRTAWFFGNVYEGLVGMPQLLADAREQRAPRLAGPGSPVRYYAPVAPLAFGATAVTLVQSWQSGGDRRLITTTSVSMALAAALSTYLVRSVNLYLLASDEPLSEHDRHRLIVTWHRTNAVRLVALAVASASLSRIASKQSGSPLRSGKGDGLLAASS
ncbi:hypothetical protein FHX42_002195 [Saccharopolyspora lacisalsi]|uniref:DUF1772 domain-containing protein n=1 Tax=Halosaccharopolyspora lacisalsi TaxID=1000566 RepID=A0A839E1L7_9PSEU|nr:DUF1772 domain-containing protein [Halosaccharopolyspora lacisalsi]MBA8824848.1 hypothetical protein [Halosaccharopolyspora lacisalsi]